METTQIFLLTGVVTALTILLIIIGVQVFFILREVQQSIKKMNKILDDAGIVSGSIATLPEKITAISGITGLLGWLINRKKKKDEKHNE